jgi:hypothetical protein
VNRSESRDVDARSPGVQRRAAWHRDRADLLSAAIPFNELHPRLRSECRGLPALLGTPSHPNDPAQQGGQEESDQ